MEDGAATRAPLAQYEQMGLREWFFVRAIVQWWRVGVKVRALPTAPGDRYQPGSVVRFDKLGYSRSILLVATLGDSVFWEHHCVSWTSAEGYTTFTSPSPVVVVPESTLAMWWRSAADDGGDWGLPQVVQLVRAATLEFRKAKPPK